MKLSTRARYGIRAMAKLAEHYGGGPMQLRVIAKNEEISFKYLEQLIAILKSTGIVRSVRGPRGGYMLAKPPNEIKLSEVFTALEGEVAPTECLEDESYCSRSGECVTRDIWRQVQQAILSVLDSITLQDLVERAKNKRSLSYQI